MEGYHSAQELLHVDTALWPTSVCIEILLSTPFHIQI